MWDSPGSFLLAVFAAACIGLSKAGFSGTSLLAVAIFTQMYGATRQAGLVLPMLILADLVVYPAFRKHGSWKDVWVLTPAAIVGLGLGWWLLGWLEAGGHELLARRVIGGVVLAMLVLTLLKMRFSAALQKLADHRAAGTAAGVAGGATSMLANAAGPVIQLYLLSRRIPKMELIGIGARFFLLINLLKVPLNRSLGLINPETLKIDLVLAPAIVAGVFVGKWLISRVPQRAFEWMVIGFAALASLRMLL